MNSSEHGYEGESNDPAWKGASAPMIMRLFLLSKLPWVVLAPDMLVTETSRSSRFLFGAVPGSNFAELLDGYARSAFERAFENSTRARGASTFRFTLNGIHFLEARLEPLFGCGGLIVMLISFNDVSEEVRAKAEGTEARKAMDIDPLTGAYNRRWFEREVPHEVERSHRSGLPLSLGVLDIDNMRMLNEQFGHDGVDKLLRGVIADLKCEVRFEDSIARIGGDEFAILLPGAGIIESIELGGRMAEAVRSAPFSMGLATLMPDWDMDDLYRHADQGLFLSKSSGKGQVRHASEWG